MGWDWDGTVTLGTVIQTVVLLLGAVGAWYKLKAELESFRGTLAEHANALSSHTTRLDRHEERLLEVVGDVQRVVGQVEGWNMGGVRAGRSPAP